MRLASVILLFAAVLAPAIPSGAQEGGVHIHLVFDGAGTAEDPCHTGDVTSSESLVGDQDELLACIHTGNEIPHTTTSSAETLRWTIRPAGGGEVTATVFTSDPPTETAEDGQAPDRSSNPSR